MNLIDIWNCLQDCQTQEVTAMFELSKLMNIDWILWLNCQHLNVMRNFKSEQNSTANFDVNSLSWIELFVWFWFYLILFWSNLTSAATFFSLNLCFKFHKKLLNLIRILQSNLSWFFYEKKSSSERFWFYSSLF